MRFWDTSAVVPLLVEEPSSPIVRSEYDRDPELLVWWATSVECVSALARRERDGAFQPTGMTAAVSRLDAIAAAWREVLPTDTLRRLATRLLRVHALRTADALQLASASIAAEGRPDTLAVVTLDDRLAIAAEREGFPVVMPR